MPRNSGNNRIRHHELDPRVNEATTKLTDYGSYSRGSVNAHKLRDWATTDGIIGKYINEERGRTLQSYQTQPNYVTEHANQEEDTARGGYADRQLFELVQNGADALSQQSGRIEIRLTGTHLYCADSGEGIDTEGVRALMFSYLSPKRGTDEIGRFGLGFKSVLGVTDSPEFFSRSGSFRFDRESAKQMIQSQAPKQSFERYPVLRLAMPIDPQASADEDPILRSTMSWASNIVRLPLKYGALTRLTDQAKNFPPEFLLFVQHVAELNIKIDDLGIRRAITLSEEDGDYHLNDGAAFSRWKVFHRMHQLSPEARADSRALDEATQVPIWWAAPLDGSNAAGHFWAFFPTSTPSLVPGIVNAPWKTNEDRQNTLPGIYNEELVEAAARLIADNIYLLSTPEDPAKHIDALPRRARQVDEGHTVNLGDHLFKSLFRRSVIPDLEGNLRCFDELRFPPELLMRRRRGYDDEADKARELWYSSPPLPTNWLHETATTVTRWPFVERLCDPDGRLKTDGGDGTPATSLREWLEALVDIPTYAPCEQRTEVSKSAILVAAELMHAQEFRDAKFAKVVLKKSGDFAAASEAIFLPTEGFDWSSERMVHPQLADDPETRKALMSLGVEEATVESRFDLLVNALIAGQSEDRLEANDWALFWRASQGVNSDIATRKLKEFQHWQNRLRVRTISGEWRPINQVLLPGAVVPTDGSRDAQIAIDVEHHREDEVLIRKIGISDSPTSNWHFTNESEYQLVSRRSVEKFQDLATNAGKSQPQAARIVFDDPTGVGPTEILKELSTEAQTSFTQITLQKPHTFEKWTVNHASRKDYYDSLAIKQPIILALEKHGRIQTSAGAVPFVDALGENPVSREAQRILLDHPNAQLIREAFDLHDPPQTRRTPINADSPVRLVETWPGLVRHLSLQNQDLNLIRCQFIEDEYGDVLDIASAVHGGDLLVTRMDREDELRAIAGELNALRNEGEFYGILNQPTPESIRMARRIVQRQLDDASRLLMAVGEDELRRGLPDALIAYYSRNGRPFDGKELANAAIATYHTGALKEYRHALTHLDPPKQWAGSQPAIRFVTDIGFSPEWAGERNTKRDPFLEVPGPIKLPPLHDYQNIVANKLRQLLRSSSTVLSDHRAMISLPTGSGKTRVAVEGIISAIAEDGFSGGILWVADRDELCEQAVQAWQEVWRAKGTRDQLLRISRMWQGQHPPLATDENHVVVASVQTLSSKLKRGISDYDFLRDFRLIVFDEAHRSIAPTFTSVMEELGFSARNGEREPLLLGLTATPYRGYSESETRWLANRYGQNRLDRGAFLSDDADKVMRQLQEMEILARATHMEIEGSEFELSEQERIQAMATPWLSTDTENRIARDAARTERIIRAYKDYIGNQSEVWPTLIFATSVEHAQTLAAILSADGISARAVSGGTDRYTRRQVVEQFRAGELKVLVNYGVFREGFDAPKTRAIIVARPVYSPNLYFQMIGRGLRGIKNGGNDRCLILDVNDNIINFERNLAFTELEWLWN